MYTNRIAINFESKKKLLGKQLISIRDIFTNSLLRVYSSIPEISESISTLTVDLDFTNVKTEKTLSEKEVRELIVKDLLGGYTFEEATEDVREAEVFFGSKGMYVVIVYSNGASDTYKILGNKQIVHWK